MKSVKDLLRNVLTQVIIPMLLTVSLMCATFQPGLASSETKPREMLTKLGVSYNKPEQIHLAFGVNPNDIVIMWSSSSSEKSSIDYSANSNSAKIKTVNAQSTELTKNTYNAKKFIFRAELKDLSPGARYSYRIKNGISGIKSDVIAFNVPHNDVKKPQTFMVLADMGLHTTSLQFVVHEAVNGKYEAVFHIGDFAYNLNSDGGRIGDIYMNRIQKFASVVPYMPTPGDHEMFDGYNHYGYRFSTPGANWPMKEDELWYSFNIGLVHFISISTDGLLKKGTSKEKQLSWLRKDLIQASNGTDRQQHPWVIVMGHKPVYCSKSVMEQECDKEFSGLRESLEDMFFEYGVDLYLSGHKHCYERSWPMYRGTVFQKNYVDPSAPTYIVSGALGYEYLVDGQLSKPYWLAASSSVRGKELFGKLKIVNGTHLIWSVHGASNNEEIDNIQLIRSRHVSYGTPGQIALEKLKERHSNPHAHRLPPEPFKIIDVPVKNSMYYYTGISRRSMLIAGVFALSFLLCLFLRFSKFRKAFKI